MLGSREVGEGVDEKLTRYDLCNEKAHCHLPLTKDEEVVAACSEEVSVDVLTRDYQVCMGAQQRRC